MLGDLNGKCPSRAQVLEYLPPSKLVFGEVIETLESRV